MVRNSSIYHSKYRERKKSEKQQQQQQQQFPAFVYCNAPIASHYRTKAPIFLAVKVDFISMIANTILWNGIINFVETYKLHNLAETGFIWYSW